MAVCVHCVRLLVQGEVLALRLVRLGVEWALVALTLLPVSSSLRIILPEAFLELLCHLVV